MCMSAGQVLGHCGKAERLSKETDRLRRGATESGFPERRQREATVTSTVPAQFQTSATGNKHSWELCNIICHVYSGSRLVSTRHRKVYVYT